MGALEPKTVAGVSKKAFTLAEVLITLAIIGVVAALTIPTVVANYQKKAYYTAFMKAYNTLSTAKNLAEAEHGFISTWGMGNDSVKNKKLIEEKLFPYLKISKICETDEDCGITSDLTMSNLNYVSDDPRYATNYYKDTISAEYGAPVLITADGSMFYIDIWKFWDNGTKGDFNIYFDTNGVKGPNIMGRDIFYITFVYGQGEPEGGMPTWTLEETKEECSTEQESYGDGCSYRLLLEGKMDY